MESGLEDGAELSLLNRGGQRRHGAKIRETAFCQHRGSMENAGESSPCFDGCCGNWHEGKQGRWTITLVCSAVSESMLRRKQRRWRSGLDPEEAVPAGEKSGGQEQRSGGCWALDCFSMDMDS